MPDSSALIERIAHDNNIDLAKASDKQIAFLFKLVFKEIEQTMNVNLAYFPKVSLIEIDEALNVIYARYLILMQQPIDPSILNDMMQILPILIEALSHISAAVKIQLDTIVNPQEYREALVQYNRNVLWGHLELVKINMKLQGS